MQTSRTATTVRILGALLGCGLLASLLLSCSSRMAQLTQTAIHEADVPDAYLIGPEDVLEIIVWKNQTLSKVVTVLPDGKIALPLVGDIQAAGATPSQIKEEITEKLKPYYREFPEVSVIVQQVNSHIYVIGEVERPGRYVVKSGTSVLQAIALAGGLTQYASPNKIVLLRNENGTNNGQQRTSLTRIRYRDIISGRNLETNITLKTGDTIIVH